MSWQGPATAMCARERNPAVRYLLDLAYALLLLVLSPWLLYAILVRGRYRHGLSEKLLGRVPRRGGTGRCIWLHAVSVGEVNVLATLVAHLERELPDVELVVSTTTPTGHELARRRLPRQTVFFCPLDFSWATRQALRRVRPDLVVLIELELWPNLVLAAREFGARVALVNGRLSDRSFRGYRRLRPFLAFLLRRLDLIAVQTEQYAARFRQLGAPPATVQVTGSIKFDGAQGDRRNPVTAQLSRLAGIAPEDVVFLAGSTQAPEEQLALATFRELRRHFPQLRLILVPRHPERFTDVAALLDQSGLIWQRRSELEQQPPRPGARVLLVDTIGELGAWWGTAQIAYVGGSLGRRGGQNMIEPAAYGAAVSFGPRTENFRDVVAALRAADAAVVVADGPALTGFVRWCLESPQAAVALGQRARQLVAGHAGAAGHTAQQLTRLLAVSTDSPGRRTDGGHGAAAEPVRGRRAMGTAPPPPVPG